MNKTNDITPKKPLETGMKNRNLGLKFETQGKLETKKNHCIARSFAVKKHNRLTSGDLLSKDNRAVGFVSSLGLGMLA